MEIAYTIFIFKKCFLIHDVWVSLFVSLAFGCWSLIAGFGCVCERAYCDQRDSKGACFGIFTDDKVPRGLLLTNQTLL